MHGLLGVADLLQRAVQLRGACPSTTHARQSQEDALDLGLLDHVGQLIEELAMRVIGFTQKLARRLFGRGPVDHELA
jgi:enoyl-CoA hydratase/carnithine racemase